ncbi:asparaginyl-trna synthetase [Lasallia pustulata]|uniref:Asparaginyl-trna synthetase n=1 Tax=Lasallia pustulata TaxID=136370 RepID=A0A1W5CRT9_9LECA|nr:asparaginyl-trna synthetase [Lasallia pustulata]
MEDLRNAAVENHSSILALPPVTEGHEPLDITVLASVRTVRNQKKRSFVELGDGSTIHSLQAVLEPSQCRGLTTGTSVEISGLWEACPTGKEQTHELKAREVKIVGGADPETYPIQKKYHSAEFLRTVPHLRLRTPFNALLARIRSRCDYHLTNYFHKQDFVRLHPPIITSSDCEGAGEVFTIDSKQPRATDLNKDAAVQKIANGFFRTPKYLTVSSQLHLEAFIHEHQKVWTLSPTFRAEQSDTPRHLSEFWMLETEIRTERLDEVMDLAENMIRSIVMDLQDSKLGVELLSAKRTRENGLHDGQDAGAEAIERRWRGLMSQPWPRITFREALQRLKDAVESNRAQFQYPPTQSTGLQLEHEKFLAGELGPVFVTDYPREAKPFYMLPSHQDSSLDLLEHSTVACFDLLLPEVCEVVGGSLREHRLQPLIAAMREQKVYKGTKSVVGASENDENPFALVDDLGSLEWFVDLRRYGSVPHGGFGLGFDRLLGYLAGVYNIRDMVAWPRYYQRCDC